MVVAAVVVLWRGRTSGIEHPRNLLSVCGRLQQAETLVSITVNRFMHFTVCEGSGGKCTSTPYAASYRVMTRLTLRPL
jgi:hypothetical protein